MTVLREGGVPMRSMGWAFRKLSGGVVGRFLAILYL
jgi:hypothetical protein